MTTFVAGITLFVAGEMRRLASGTDYCSESTTIDTGNADIDKHFAHYSVVAALMDFIVHNYVLTRIIRKKAMNSFVCWR